MGYTPVFDVIVKDHGFMTALVFGVIWRYCQLKKCKCDASHETLSEKIGIDRRSLLRHTKVLIDNGYLRKETNKGIGTTYFDTGKANLRQKVTGGMTESHTGYDRESQEPVTESHTKRPLKDTINNNKALGIYRKVTGLTPTYDKLDEVANNIISAFERREMEKKEFIIHLKGVYHNWCGTKSKEGRLYSPSNPKWIEWAITGRYLENKDNVRQGKEKGFYA